MVVRQPIVCVMGHVDHGKTSILDRIRQTAVAKREAGAITQHIGASEVPADVIESVCGKMLKAFKVDLKIPGLLFVDTPGHEAFTNLRRRGGAVADMAVLVVDVTQGFQPQTIEAIEILREYKTPFLVAANKLDLINGWKDRKTRCFTESLQQQNEMATNLLDEKIYQLVGRLSEYGFSSERFDRISDFTKEVPIIPVSAKTGEGLSELLVLLAGVSQRYLEKQLNIEVSGPGKASILEVKDEKGLGKTVDIVLYDGTMRKNDVIVFGTLNGAGSTKVRGLLKPKPLEEMRDPREKFMYVDEVHAASGLKIYAPGLDGALAGSSLFVVGKGSDLKELEKEVESEIKGILVESSGPGIILKADTLGSIEGASKLLEDDGVPIKRASIGRVGKRDVIDANNARQQNRYYGAILAFNTEADEEAISEAAKYHIPIFREDVIYTLLDNYKKWVELQRDMEKNQAYDKMVLPGKIQILPGCCFRVSKPVIVGVEVVEGRVKPGYTLVDEDGKVMGEIKTIQKDKEPVKEASKGDQLAISIDTPLTFGRQICEKHVMYSQVPKDHHKLLTTKYAEFLSPEELELLKKIRKVMGDTAFA